MKKSYLLLSILPSLMLYGCNSGSNNTFTPVALQWESCNPQTYPAITNEMREKLGNRLTCTQMIAPADYSNPSLGNIQVALSKVSARVPSERSGSIFFNPGGPGGDGLGLAPRFGVLWSDANPSNPLGAKFSQLSDEYDLIGFSPRGTGSSTALQCQQLGSTLYPLNFTESLYGEQNQYTQYLNQGLIASACRANELTPFINTDATARDMDLARSLLGDAKLSYVGYSYGTWLGTWYAGLFPTHIDKMVIDSTMNITSTIAMAGSYQAPAMQNILDNIIAPYAALNVSIYNLGTTQDVQNIYQNLNNTMQQITRNTLYSLMFKQVFASETVETLSAAKTVNALIASNPYANNEEIKELVNSYTFSNDPTVNTETMNIALAMTEAYFGFNQQQPQIVSLDSSSSTNRSVGCNDTPSPTSFEFWYALTNETKQIAFTFSSNIMVGNCTTTWNGPTVSQPSIASMRTAPAILMVQTQYDGATPLNGALKTYNALGTASMVYVTNSYTHGVFSSLQNGCADNAVANYLLAGEMPENQLLICQGEGLLPNMNSTASISSKTTSPSFLPANLASKASHGENINTDSAFKNPEQARKLQEQIQDSIINAEKINK